MSYIKHGDGITRFAVGEVAEDDTVESFELGFPPKAMFFTGDIEGAWVVGDDAPAGVALDGNKLTITTTDAETVRFVAMG